LRFGGSSGKALTQNVFGEKRISGFLTPLKNDPKLAKLAP
jgi:hypothetical protein